MTVKHEAFLDLEAAVAKRLSGAWNKVWAPVADQAVDLFEQGLYDEAHEVVNTLDISPVFDKNEKYIRVMLVGALMLGVSRVTDVNDSTVKGSPPEELIVTAMGQFRNMVVDNAELALKLDAHIYLDKLEFEETTILKADGLSSKAFRFSVQTNGKAHYDIAASLMISRMSSAGMLMEARATGYQQYRISTVMDLRTCPVCEVMSNQIFPIDDGLNQSQVSFLSDDPAHLKAVAPWPSQRKEAVSQLSAMTSSEKSSAGYSLPPYHPLCRCIAVTEDAPVDIGDLSTLSSLQTMTSSQSLRDVGQQLFGNMTAASIDAGGFLAVGGASALFTLEAGLVEEEDITQ